MIALILTMLSYSLRMASMLLPKFRQGILCKNIYYIGIFKRSDERTIYNVIYRDGGVDGAVMVKRCTIKNVTRDKVYEITKSTPNLSST